jgi:hypothetical protein
MQRRQASGAGCWRRAELADLYRGRRRGEVLAAEGEVPVYGLPGADLSVTTGQDVVVVVICGYEQGGYTPAVSYSAQFTSNVSALYAAAVADG